MASTLKSTLTAASDDQQVVKTSRRGVENRRTPRRIYQRPIGILLHGVYDVFQGLQLSEGGLLFRSEKMFAVKSQIVATLVMPGGGVIVTRGEVIYARPDSGRTQQFGVKFTSLPLHLRRVIRNYVTAKTQAEAEAEAVKDSEEI